MSNFEVKKIPYGTIALVNSKMSMRSFFSSKYFFWTCLVLVTILYAFLMYDYFFFLVPLGVYDDGLQFKLAKSLSSGEWLGTYDYLTLAKGITFPAWMAFFHVLDIPLWFANTMLYVLASLAMLLAVSQSVRSRLVLGLVYVIVLFNPFITARAYRDSIAPALVLLVFAWIIGTYFVVVSGVRAKRYKAKLVVFSSVGAVGFTMWWFLREDSFWILPFVLGATGTIVGLLVYRFVVKRITPKGLVFTTSMLVAPFLVFAATYATIASINNYTYGRYVVNDYTSPEFEDAYGALTRIKDDNWQRTVPVSEGMRIKAYSISPLFKELQPCLDGQEQDGNCEFFRYNNKAINNSDYEGGWFFWALRFAVQEKGYYANPELAAEYYRNLANEINTACNGGKIDCEFQERSGLTAPYRTDINDVLITNTLKSVEFIMSADSYGIDPSALDGYSVERDEMAKYLNVRYMTAELNPLAKVKRAILNNIVSVYEVVNLSLFIIASLALVFLTVIFIRVKKYRAVVLVGWGLFFTILLRAFMLAYIETTSFPAIITLYFSSTYPLMFLYEGLFVGLLVYVILHFRAFLPLKSKKTIREL